MPTNSVKFTPTIDGFVKVHAKYGIYFSQKDEDGLISCKIPAFGIYYSVESKEEMHKIGKELTNLFFDHFIGNKSEIKSYHQLAKDLTRRGFRADGMTMRNLLVKKITKTSILRTEDRDILSDDKNYEVITQESELQLAQ